MKKLKLFYILLAIALSLGLTMTAFAATSTTDNNRQDPACSACHAKQLTLNGNNHIDTAGVNGENIQKNARDILQGDATLIDVNGETVSLFNGTGKTESATQVGAVTELTCTTFSEVYLLHKGHDDGITVYTDRTISGGSGQWVTAAKMPLNNDIIAAGTDSQAKGNTTITTTRTATGGSGAIEYEIVVGLTEDKGCVHSMAISQTTLHPATFMSG